MSYAIAGCFRAAARAAADQAQKTFSVLEPENFTVSH